MKTIDFDYNLKKELIAQNPVTPRDHSKLLIYDRKNKKIYHKFFYNIEEFLTENDVLVVNKTKVIPARLYGEKLTGAKIEILLLKKLKLNVWDALVKPGKRLSIGTEFYVGKNELIKGKIIDSKIDGIRTIQFDCKENFEQFLDKNGFMPLPPYITNSTASNDRYQTVYAKDFGSAASPTAGLHFTKELIDRLKSKNVTFSEILLHVGLGTFRPVNVENINDHIMHEEYYELDETNASIINKAIKEKKRIIAVGTTSARVLETLYKQFGKLLQATKGYTNIFIYPPYNFFIDGLITNFHLPKSTLLMLVSALCSREEIMYIYEEAMKNKYRFYSYGDAMFIF